MFILHCWTFFQKRNQFPICLTLRVKIRDSDNAFILVILTEGNIGFVYTWGRSLLISKKDKKPDSFLAYVLGFLLVINLSLILGFQFNGSCFWTNGLPPSLSDQGLWIWYRTTISPLRMYIFFASMNSIGLNFNFVVVYVPGTQNYHFFYVSLKDKRKECHWANQKGSIHV